MLAKLFAVLFSLLFVGFILLGLSILIFAIATFVEQFIKNFQLQRQADAPPLGKPTDAIAREEVLRLRAEDDRERLERVRQARADLAIRRRGSVAPEGFKPPCVGQEIDVTEELFDTEKHFLVCRDTKDGWTFFHSSLVGRATERGARNVRFLFIRTKSLARRFTLHEARTVMSEIGQRGLFVVDAYDQPPSILNLIEEPKQVSTQGA